MEENNIIKIIELLVGDIHTIGESYTDRERFNNLKNLGEVLSNVIGDVADELENIKSYEYSRKRNGEKAKEILINIRNEINESLELYCGDNYVSYYIGFINNEGKEDETQFDILAYKDHTEAIEELMSLFNDFCKENNIKERRITYIEIGEEDQSEK